MELFKNLIYEKQIKYISEDYREITLYDGATLRLTLEQVETFKDAIKQYIEDDFTEEWMIDEDPEDYCTGSVMLYDQNIAIGNTDIYFDMEVSGEQTYPYEPATWDYPGHGPEYEFEIEEIILK